MRSIKSAVVRSSGGLFEIESIELEDRLEVESQFAVCLLLCTTVYLD